MKITATGQSIEGSSVKGQSRCPLRARGLQKHNGIKCYIFVARFDVRAATEKPLVGEPELEENAITSTNVEIVCQDATVKSKKRRYQREVAKGSSTHKTNRWVFPQHTSVRITASHPEILAATEKRARLEA